MFMVGVMIVHGASKPTFFTGPHASGASTSPTSSWTYMQWLKHGIGMSDGLWSILKWESWRMGDRSHRRPSTWCLTNINIFDQRNRAPVSNKRGQHSSPKTKRCPVMTQWNSSTINPFLYPVRTFASEIWPKKKFRRFSEPIGMRCFRDDSCVPRTNATWHFRQISWIFGLYPNGRGWR